MSYLALARKWRPRRFEDVLGQQHVVQALAHALSGDRLHPAILLTGTRGVGKTTLGRIIAKGLNCETGVTATPCGQCSACREVDEGRFVDLLEIDAASRTKVDDTRQLLDNVQYSPVRGRYKVYLIDEVHMLSNSSFNALLKTLEEPPPHVKFILATTDPQKLPITVLSRCLQFALKRLPVALIRDNLAAVLEREGIAAEAGVCTEIARAADGSMRDGLSLLDQAIAFAGGETLKTDSVEEMIGAVGRRTLFDILEALANASPEAMLACIRRLESQAPDYAALLSELATRLQRMAVLQLLPAADDENEEPQLRELAARMAPEDVQLYYQIAIMGRRDLPWAPDPRLGFEMTLIRMLTFRPDTGGPAGGGASAGGQRTQGGRAGGTHPAMGATNGAPNSAVGAAASTAAPRMHAPVAAEDLRGVPSANSGVGTPNQVSAPQPAASTPRALHTIGSTALQMDAGNVPQPTAAVAVGASARVSTMESAAPLRPVQPDPQALARKQQADEWAEKIESLGLEAVTRQLARHCAWEQVEAQVIRLRLEYAVRHLLTDERQRELERALSVAAGAIYTVDIQIAPEHGVIASAAQRARERAVERQQQAEADFAKDAVVQQLMRQFDATIRPDSVRPID